VARTSNQKPTKTEVDPQNYLTAVEREQVARYQQKTKAGQVPTGAETRAYERAEFLLRQRMLKRFPKAELLELVGLSVGQAHKWADRWSIPLRGTREGRQVFVDVGAVVARFVELVTDNAYQLRSSGGAQPETLQHWKTENEKAKAERNRVRADREKKHVVAIDTHERAIDGLCGAFRAALLRASHELAGKTAGQSLLKNRETIKAWAEDVCDQYFGKPEW